MKKYLSLLFLALCAIALQAKPINASIAQAAAQKLATAQLAMERATPNLVYTGSNESFFIFNVGDHGFVIIAGDDAYRPVIG